MITHADPKLTKADFDAEPWEQSLGAAEEPTCFKYCGPLKTKLEQCKAAGQDRVAEIYALLHATASLCSSWDSSTRPFRRFLDFGPSCRSAALDDFGADEISVLMDVAPDIEDPEFRARVADVTWVLRRDYKMAGMAIPAYVASAIRLEGTAHVSIFIDRLNRAIQLALGVGQGDQKLLSSVTSEIEKFVQKRAPTEKQRSCADLMRLLIQAEAGDRAKYSALCGSLASQAEGRQDWDVARTYWGCKAEWHRLAKEREQHRDDCVKAAETYVGEAESALQRPTPSPGACAGLLLRAVEALRKIPGTKERVGELHQRIVKEQELIVATETTTLEVSTDISEVVHSTMAAFRSKPLEQVLLELAMIGAPPAISSLRAAAEESMRTDIFSQIVPSVYITEKGKRLAEKPSAMDGDEHSQAQCLKAEMMRQIKWQRGMMVSSRIRPALHVINSEHFVRLEDLEAIVRDNPFVPNGREPIFMRGLFAGLSGDFLLAAHLLVPQIENSIRHLLYHCAGEPRTSKLKSNLTQPERDLNELLYHDDVKRIVDEDLLFDLQSLMVEPGFGANLRNQIAHGLMDTEQFYADEAVYAWWLIWRICCMPSLIRMQALAKQAGSSIPSGGCPA